MLTPGVRADVRMLLADDGTVLITHGKIMPEEEEEIFRRLTYHWLGAMARAGITPDPELMTLSRPN